MNTYQNYDFDVIVVGGGHAGIEAAYTAAKMGSKTLFLTLDVDRIGLMSCNPAIGGVGKGHIVYEISALGGLMPKLCTKTYLQARLLNTRKGPAVQGLRLQIDRAAYSQLSKKMLEHTDNLTLHSGMVEELILDNARNVHGVRTRDGINYRAPVIVLTTGTFLRGRIHVGEINYPAGRQGDESVPHLSPFLKKIGITIGRLKTGTPPRLLCSSIDFSKLERQQADNLNYLFEFYPHKVINSRDCYIAYTNEKTHEIIRKNVHRSAMYNGGITSVGPRYCPSIEDKINRFPDKQSHHIFLEPEGVSTQEMYPNGLATSLPFDVQRAFIHSIHGFEEAIITCPGYAIEYDFVLPTQLKPSLELCAVNGLFLAGQINGTTGYEEAAGQGIVAGINAHLKRIKQPPFILDRTESYIGVMIDDLISFGIDEPYRMFTSRAEHRLFLRQDNAFLRLTEKGYNLGLIDEQLYKDFKREKEIIEQTLTDLRAGHNNSELLKLFGNGVCNKEKIAEYVGKEISEQSIQTIHAEIRYEPYLKREKKDIQRTHYYRKLTLPATLDYRGMPGLSRELQEKLIKYRPVNIAQASLIPGMTPAALLLLIFKTKEHAKWVSC